MTVQSGIMQFGIYVILCIAYSYALENEPETNQEPDLQRDLQEFVRKLTQQQMQTTQQMQSQNQQLLPHLNLPLLRPQSEGKYEEIDSPLSLLNFPPQSNVARSGAHSFASSSVSVKRPFGSSDVDAKAISYASVKDVNEEEHLAEILDSPEKSSTTNEFHKKSPVLDAITSESDDDSSRTGPFAMKQQQGNTVLKAEDSFSDVYFVAIVAGCCAVGIFGVISAGFCFYKLQKSRKAAADVDYPAYGVTGPSKDLTSPNGDRKLAQSAQMYHYQHQKQQMIAVEKAGSTKNTSASDVDSEEENEEGDYTVYECPGLAPTGEMEVKNPLFHDDSTPVSPPVLPSKPDSNQNN